VRATRHFLAVWMELFGKICFRLQQGRPGCGAFWFHLMVREDPPLAGLRFVTVFVHCLLPFTADLCNGLNLHGHFGGFVS
jgi:hypothetical protein